MDESRKHDGKPENPRRRRRTKMQIFKESYLPVLIAGVALLLIFIFIIGAIVRGVQRNRLSNEESIAASIAAQKNEERLAEEEKLLLAQAADYAKDYDYDGAIAILNTFSGDMSKYPDISEKVKEYSAQKKSLVAWNDLSQVPNLSFQMLMVDPQKSFSHSVYGSAFNKNYVTTTEFENILIQLYNNGYILVNADDFVNAPSDATGTYTPKTLYLPQGKKPIILTQTNVNYNIYIVDGDGDKLPDKNGAGFASKLVLTADGNITCERVDRNGNVVTGAFDLIPILENFIQEHPEFSYRGARATIALTGYNGLFGYRTYAGAEKDFGIDAYNSDVAQATKVANALRKKGYVLACYTYHNISYGEYSAGGMEADLNQWLTEALPILGQVDTMVFAHSDISTTNVYSGTKFSILQSAGFRYYYGFCVDGENWGIVNNDYVRLGRILVSGSNMQYHKDWFDGLFDPSAILEYDIRGNIPK